MKIKAANAPVTFEETIMVLITNDVVRLSKMTLSRTLHAVGVDKGAKLNGWLRLQCLYYKQVFDGGGYTQRNKKTFQSAIFIARSLSMP